LDDGFCGNGAGTGAAFLVKEAEDFAQGLGVGGIPKKGAVAADVDEAHLFELFKVMRKRRCGNTEFFLDFSGDHAGGMRGEEETKNLQTRLSAESSKAVGGAGNENRVRVHHSSIFAEI
jgi:hypothetical protein